MEETTDFQSGTKWVLIRNGLSYLAYLSLMALIKKLNTTTITQPKALYHR